MCWPQDSLNFVARSVLHERSNGQTQLEVGQLHHHHPEAQARFNLSNAAQEIAAEIAVTAKTGCISLRAG
jgi:hypothetical protein